MEIVDLDVIHGANYWSNVDKQLIVLTINPEKSESSAINKIPGFQEKLKAVIPSLFNPEKIFYSVQQELFVPEVIGYIAQELQILVGLNCSFVKTNKSHNTHKIVISYTEEKSGIYAIKAAVKIVHTLIKNEEYTNIKKDIEELALLKINNNNIGPTTGYLLNEIKKRKIPYRQFNEGSMLTLGHGLHQKKIRTAVTDSTSGLGMELASDKQETKLLLSGAHIPVPGGILVDTEEELEKRIAEVRFPIVVKPLNGNHGRGVTTHIYDLEKALFGFRLAQKISSTVIIEEFIEGDDYRFLVVDYKLVAATKRSPASVTGDGKSTIQQLIDKENQNPQRGKGTVYVLAKIKVDEVTNKILSDKNLTLETVIPAGEMLVLKDTANISAGGTATDVTDSVHPENVFFAERVARMFNLNICGVDIVATAVNVPITREIGAVIEVNAGPGLRMHSNPQIGTPRNVAAKIADMLFPDINAVIIPIVVVSEFKGANIVTRLITHLIQKGGFKPACNTSEGIYVQGHLTAKGNCTGYLDMQEVLFEPTIDFAVLECSDISILESGLAFDKSNITVIADASEINPKLNGHNIPEEKLKIRKVLTDNTVENGWVILNADDAQVYRLLPEIKCNTAIYSINRNNEHVKVHCEKGGIAVIVDKGEVFIYKENKSTPLIKLINISDNAEALVKYILPAVVVAVVKGFHVPVIKEALLSFAFAPAEAHSYNI